MLRSCECQHYFHTDVRTLSFILFFYLILFLPVFALSPERYFFDCILVKVMGVMSKAV